MTLAERIKERRLALDLRQEEVAQRCGVSSFRVVSAWEKGTGRPSPQNLLKLAEVLKVKALELLELADAERIVKGAYVEIWKAAQTDLGPVGDVEGIPVFDLAAAYDEDWTDGSHPVGCADEFITVAGVGQDAFACRLHGDSMNPRFQDGDILIFEPEVPVENGDLALIRAREWATFKQVFFTGDQLRLVPLNRAYPDRVIACEEEVINIVKMVGLFRRF